MNRRDFLKLAAASSVTLPFWGCYEKSPQSPSPSKPSPPNTASLPKPSPPNIIFIIADDLGWADVGYHGSEIKTPNIDNLARQGLHLEQNYVMPTCTPTRVGFLTGHYPSRYGVLAPAYGKIFNDDTITLAQALHHCRYSTHIAGKWHMGSPPDYTPLKYGFDTSYGYFHGQVDPYTHRYKTGVPTWHRNDQELRGKGHVTDLITKEALRIVESKHDKPFFLYVAYSAPHFPLNEPKKWTSMYPHIKNASRKWYAASVSHMDDGIGKIVTALDRRHLRNNTLIIFVSDNGGQKNWHNKSQYHGRYAGKPHTVLGNNKPLRGWKGDLYEGAIRVPALVNQPGVIKPGKMNIPIHIVDWMPTLCAIAACSPERDLDWDGMNIWPLLCNDQNATQLSSIAAPFKTRSLYWKTQKGAATRQGDWKLIVDKKTDKAQLYNLANDPYEKNNLAAEQPARVQELRNTLQEIARKDR